MVKLKSTQKTYAMKIIKKSIIDDEDDIEWVQTEKNVFEQASNHPFLVRHDIANNRLSLEILLLLIKVLSNR